MIVGNSGSFLGIIFLWQWRFTALFAAAAAAVAIAHEVLGWTHLVLPSLPLAVVGAALGIFVSFRTNSAYDRWWEGRRLWGQLVNSSRHFCNQVLAYLPANDDGTPSPAQRALVLRHVSYVHVLRCALREQPALEDAEVKAHVDPDHDVLRTESNLAHALLARQQNALSRLADDGALAPMRLHSLDQTLATLLDVQGGCERIKRTPMPRVYGFLAQRLVQFYGVLFPLAIVEDLGWWTIPLNLLVCIAFAVISEAGRVLEDPFTMFWNGLPLSALSRMIEVNLRQRLGDADLPPLLAPNPRGILM